MSNKNGVRDTKIVFKLPTNINKGKIIGACSTATRASIEGYQGIIKVISSAPDKKDTTFLPCRPVGHGGKAWVQIKTGSEFSPTIH